jgi:hypothetical protein
MVRNILYYSYMDLRPTPMWDLVWPIRDVNVRAGERQVLKGPSETHKVSWINNMRLRLRRRLWHVCPSALKPAYSLPCQLAQEYWKQIDAEWGKPRPPNVVWRLPENDGGVRCLSWWIPAWGQIWYAAKILRWMQWGQCHQRKAISISYICRTGRQ